jgi:hypothetical protein
MLRLGVSQEEGADDHDDDEIKNATRTLSCRCVLSNNR